jgi:hypothetical protein
MRPHVAHVLHLGVTLLISQVSDPMRGLLLYMLKFCALILLAKGPTTPI